ncbi:hypothetical protein evm_004535 [Chilo suppressalis]|nr:hypothetical protein evm_004535 [Chilo suppressalis]
MVHEKVMKIMSIRYDVLYTSWAPYCSGTRDRDRHQGVIGSIDRLGLRPRGVFYRQTEELDLLRELRVITKRYSQAKEAISGNNSRDLSYFNAKFPEELDTSLKKVIDGIPEKSEDTKESNDTSMKAIKEKAMKLSVDGMRHLQSATAKNKSPKKQSPKKAICEIKQKPGGVRRQSPKPVTLVKRKTSGKLPKAKKRKRKNSDSSSNKDQSTPPNETNSDNHTDTSNDINLDNFDKEKIIDSNNDDTTDASDDLILDDFAKEKIIGDTINDNTTATSKQSNLDNVENQHAEEKEIYISIDCLPVYIREEQGGKLYEIEIIDELKSKLKDEKQEKAISKNLEDGEGTSEGVNEKAEVAEFKPAPVKRQTKQNKEIDKKTHSPLLRRKEKRDLKKPVMKSKFKRLGMLKVANFNDDDKSAGVKKKEKD